MADAREFVHVSDQDLREAVLGNWVQLQKVLPAADGLLAHRLLALEMRSSKPRLQIVQRLYGRLTKMRREREWRALVAGVANGQNMDNGLVVRASEGVIRDLAPQGRSDW